MKIRRFVKKRRRKAAKRLADARNAKCSRCFHCTQPRLPGSSCCDTHVPGSYWN